MFAGAPDFQSRPEHGKWPSGMQHNFDRGSDSDFNDLGGWNRASFNHHPCDDLEPVDLEPNGYRAISLDLLKVMFSVDEFVTAAPDA